MSELQAPATPVRDGPEGIGGWLILPIIGMCLTPVQGLVQLSQYSELSENFQFLTSAQQVFVGIEIVGNVIIALILPITLLILLFSKRRAFPRLYVVWAVSNLVFIFGDLLAAQILFGDVFEATDTPLIDDETRQAIIRAIILMVIWVPYMLMSRRVRNTFTQ